ncbi:MAG: Cobalamin (Vitamin B12) biosynthesis CbiM protein [uncultured bacterium]|nr:MAG: Cobalamin (Vitamin B12) biosynthesis CbiM protein [uncultured bacterium]
MCAGLLALSNTVDWGIAFPAMAGVHALIGMGEALITSLIITALLRIRPELVTSHDRPCPALNSRALAPYGLLISAGLVLFVAPFACGWPDGLEKVAGTLGFEHFAKAVTMPTTLFADYTTPWLSTAFLSTVLAGTVGVITVFGFSYLCLLAIKKRADS